MTRAKTKVEGYSSWRSLLQAHPHQPRPADWKLVHAAQSAARNYSASSDRELRQAADELRTRLQGGEPPLSRDAITTAFALTSEAVHRTLGYRLYDVQLLAGLILATGAIGEMQTGEGKTLVAALPAVLYGFTGAGVHVATTNAYLAARDHAQLQPTFARLGLTVGLLTDQAPPEQTAEAYLCDITYGTGYQFGFDFLRDQVALRTQPRGELGENVRRALTGLPAATTIFKRQRQHAIAVVDEIDSVLIDEAATPLILSGPAGAESTEPYRVAGQLVESLKESVDYLLEGEPQGVSLTALGNRRAHAAIEKNTDLQLARPWRIYVQNALRARHLLHRDVEYVVQDDAVQIVDPNTGRIFADRSWRDGLHQAVEEAEGVTIREGKQSIARVTRQRYFQRYEKLCGMTGTAVGNEAELREFYGLPVVVVPPRLASQRVEWPTRYFADQQAKHRAIIHEAVERSSTGQPILIATRTIEGSRSLSQKLNDVGLEHVVLNGVQDESEAEIVSQAGQHGAVTIATNMAGRGTDIPLSDRARHAGGLHVLGVERQKSLRIDRQLLGRAGRQGDPGSYQFFVAADDQLLENHAPDLAAQIRGAANAAGESHGEFDEAVSRLQQRVELESYRSRREMVHHDNWLDDVLETLVSEE